MAQKRALITGLQGFTGHYLALELEAMGWQVFGLDAGLSSDPRHCRADLLDKDALREVVAKVQPHYVAHLAGIAFVGHGDAEAFYKVNLIGTRNLLESLAAEAPALESVLLASSANVYGNATEGVITEKQAPDPANDYAVSKLAMEYMSRLWCDKLPIAITRPFNYTGVGQADNFLLPKIVGHFTRRATRIELGNLDVWRDFGDVRWVAKAYQRLLACRASGVFNICSGRAYALREVISMMEEIAGYRIEVAVNPAFVRPNEVKTLTGDASKLVSVIGDWRPCSLRDTLQWMYDHGKLGTA